MGVLIAPDSFKDSLTALEVSHAIRAGIKAYDASIPCHFLAASDGGEGFLQAIANYKTDVKNIPLTTQDALGRPLQSHYLYDADQQIAYIELAKASGLELLTEQERNPLHTSTYGTGLLIKNAIEKGAKTIFIGLGGSATNDGGIGIAEALGYQFLDEHGTILLANGNSLATIRNIKKSSFFTDEIEIFAINDVNNPLYGLQGAAYTYAKQKGATPQMIEVLDAGLQNLDLQVQKHLGIANASIAGSGAAGGTAYGLASFLNAKFIPGTSFILELAQFKSLVTKYNISLIITGEGKIDHQTAFGKFAYGILQEANTLKIPVLGVCGKLELPPDGIKDLGFLAVSEIFQKDQPIQYSFDNAALLISKVTQQLLEKHGASLF